MSEKMPAVPALWFDKDGCGPDCLAIRLQPLKAEVMPSGGVIPATLGIRIESRPDSLPVLLESGRRMVDGGFLMDRESVQQLAAGLDDWIESIAPPDAGPREKTAIDIIGRLWPAIEAANGTIHLISSWYMAIAAREDSIAALAQKAQEVCEGSGWVVSRVYDGYKFNIQCPKDGT